LRWQHDRKDRQQRSNGEHRRGGKSGLQRTCGEIVRQSKFIARMGAERIVRHQLPRNRLCERWL
jgi:hypothetical protein